MKAKHFWIISLAKKMLIYICCFISSFVSLRTSKEFHLCFHPFREGKGIQILLKQTNPYELVYSYCLAKITQSINSAQPSLLLARQLLCKCSRTWRDFCGIQKPDPTYGQGVCWMAFLPPSVLLLHAKQRFPTKMLTAPAAAAPLDILYVDKLLQFPHI